MATDPTDTRLHSRYQPAREAARFLDHHPLSPQCTDIIVVGPADGYLFPELAKRYPQAKRIGIQLTRGHDKAPGNSEAHALHLFTDAEGLRLFLDREVRAESPETLGIVQWTPAIRLEAELARGALGTLKTWSERLAASYGTTRAFAERWLVNTIRSLRLSHAHLSLTRPLGPLVLASAGPSLEETADAVLTKTPRSSYTLIAVSSAVPALLARDLVPDLVIASDGGNWAQWHLREVARHQLPLLYQLGAAIPSTMQGAPLQAIATEHAWQQRILGLRGLAPVHSPQRGTVSAVALDIALSLTEDSVYLAGLDLESGAIRSHVRPYAFDALALEVESRRQPLWHWHETRNRRYKESTAMGIYAQWYRERSGRHHARCRILSASGHPCFGMDGVTRIHASGRAGGTISMKMEDTTPRWPPENRVFIRQILDDPQSREELERLLNVGAEHDKERALESRLAHILERAKGRR